MRNPGTLTVARPTEREIVMTRVFDAPRHLVFAAWTEPGLLRRWFGPRGYELVVCEVDLRVGGTWHYVVRAPDATEMVLHGVYREIVAPERLVCTQAKDGCDAEADAESLITITLVEHDGRTTLTNTVLYPSRDVRDAVIGSGMEHGVAEGYDRLAEVLATDGVGGDGMTEIADRYRTRAAAFERKVAAVRPDQWSNQSPCKDWDARDVVRHIVDMHDAMLRPLGRGLSPGPSADDDPLGAFRSARADIEAMLDDPAVAGIESDTPSGRMSVEQHIDQVVSADMPLHGWDLARATGQDDTIDPEDLKQAWASVTSIPAEMMEKLRTPGAFGPGVKVFGPEVKVAEDAPLQDRLLGLIGRDPG